MATKTAKAVTHAHIWLINRQNIGTCSLCGEVRQFPWNGKTPATVLKEGNPGTVQVSEKDQLSIERVSEKEEPMEQHHMHKHRWYEDHKEEILVDLRSIGRRPTCIKRNIPSSTMTQLEKRWITPQEMKELSKRSYACRGGQTVRKEIVTTSTDNSQNNLPSFPEFSSEWPESVQLTWLNIYEQLRRC